MTRSPAHSDISDYEESCDDDDYSLETESTNNIRSSDDGEESFSEEEFEGDTCKALDNSLRRRPFSDGIAVRRRIEEDEEPPDYAPERWPPILDFLFVFSSFLAAVVAAYFTIF